MSVFSPIALTLRLATATTALLLLLATPLAWWIAQPWSLAQRAGWLRRAVMAAIALPLVLPPTVLGYYLLVGLGPRTAIGRALTHLLGHPLAFSFTGLLIGSVLFSLPFATLPLVAGFEALDLDMLDAARVLGARPWTLFSRLAVPLSKSAFLTAAVIAFTHTVGEFGVVLMLGGDIPGVTRTLSIALYDRVQEADYAGAGHLALALVAFSFIALLLVYARRTNGRERTA
jgi:molybdate transport system permease protein